MMKYLLTAALLFTTNAAAHELTPTYPKFEVSYIDNVYVTTMKMWNRREDVSYYEFGVFDEDFNPILFATPERLIEMDYLEQKNVEIYIHKKDLKKAEFICTTSKLLKQDVESTGVTSRVCSRVK